MICAIGFYRRRRRRRIRYRLNYDAPSGHSQNSGQINPFSLDNSIPGRNRLTSEVGPWRKDEHGRPEESTTANEVDREISRPDINIRSLFENQEFEGHMYNLLARLMSGRARSGSLGETDVNPPAYVRN